ncbi:LysE family translocator [Microbacterium murale]|uniref:Threonine/homoserine/homoserine lactone efflux protein n=1 Tax=Microbacterium murale TaxID=1081040 RepID=A0ABU0PF07_9MICO|nr:LysE family translocator [Microbacterium murale]MDQ0645612.1 threonine/homoserine/homoserine lactone efflux protein [Microbacterium murale]
MLSWEALLAFTFASFILIAIPGPSVLFVIGRSLALGRRGGILSVLGNEVGALPLVIAVSLGIGTIVAESIVVFTVIKIVGASYLVYLGIQAIRHRREGLEAGGRAGRPGVSGWVTFRQGVIVGATNPKTIVFFVAVLPQFVNYSAGNVALQMMLLGLVFTIVALLCDSVWAIAAGTARQWFSTSPKRLSAIRAAGGGMMIGLGGTLALTGNKA